MTVTSDLVFDAGNIVFESPAAPGGSYRVGSMQDNIGGEGEPKGSIIGPDSVAA